MSINLILNNLLLFKNGILQHNIIYKYICAHILFVYNNLVYYYIFGDIAFNWFRVYQKCLFAHIISIK